jgi:hypothetical protein
MFFIVASNCMVRQGFGNGEVCLMDKRLNPNQAIVHTYEQHKSWVVQVHLRANHIISASKGGDVLWWDRRFAGQAVRNVSVRPLCPMLNRAKVKERCIVFTVRSARRSG